MNLLQRWFGDSKVIHCSHDSTVDSTVLNHILNHVVNLMRIAYSDCPYCGGVGRGDFCWVEYIFGGDYYGDDEDLVGLDGCHCTCNITVVWMDYSYPYASTASFEYLSSTNANIEISRHARCVYIIIHDQKDNCWLNYLDIGNLNFNMGCASTSPPVAPSGDVIFYVRSREPNPTLQLLMMTNQMPLSRHLITTPVQ